jgi:hypothetical protein
MMINQEQAAKHILMVYRSRWPIDTIFKKYQNFSFLLENNAYDKTKKAR